MGHRVLYLHDFYARQVLAHGPRLRLGTCDLTDRSLLGVPCGRARRLPSLAFAATTAAGRTSFTGCTGSRVAGREQMIVRLTVPLALASALALAVACGSSGEGGRGGRITQWKDGCTPKTVEATAGEKLNLVVTNESGKEPYEVEGEGGTKLEAGVIPDGKTRSVGFDVPDDPGTYEIKCYIPGDIETKIEITVAAQGET